MWRWMSRLIMQTVLILPPWPLSQVKKDQRATWVYKVVMVQKAEKETLAASAPEASQVLKVTQVCLATWAGLAEGENQEIMVLQD